MDEEMREALSMGIGIGPDYQAVLPAYLHPPPKSPRSSISPGAAFKNVSPPRQPARQAAAASKLSAAVERAAAERREPVLVSHREIEKAHAASIAAKG